MVSGGGYGILAYNDGKVWRLATSRNSTKNVDQAVNLLIDEEPIFLRDGGYLFYMHTTPNPNLINNLS